jgi:hypothetical protein
VGDIVYVESLRLSLFERDQKNLFEATHPSGRRYSRESWLREIFSRETEFIHRRKHFVFVPDAEFTVPPLIGGRVGRQRTVKENDPPEGGLHESIRSIWRASVLVLDPTHHDDGQKLWIQAQDEEIGKPLSLIRSLAMHFNRSSDAPYTIDVNGIVDPQSFWDFVAKNKGDITTVTIEAVAPNMFSGKDDFVNELRNLRDKERAQRLKVEIKNDSGLNPDTERMHDVIAIRYLVAGL